MSDVSEAIATAMGTPEELVMRSALARATASGVTVDDVLAAWSGGGSVAQATSSASPVAAAPAVEAAPEPEAAPTDAAPAAAAASAAILPAAGVAVVVAAEPEVVEEEEEPFEAAPLRERLVFAAKFGGAFGLMFGIFAALVSTRFALGRVVPAFDDELLLASTASKPAQVVLYLTILTTVFGALLARGAAEVPAWFDRRFSVRTGIGSLTIVGAAVGAITGLIGSGVLLATGETIAPILEGDATLVHLAPVQTSVLLVVLMAILGAVIASAVQMSALPAGLTSEEQDESDVIKHRLVTSYVMPAMVMLAIASMVLPFAWLLVTFHSMAPLIASVAAVGILTFAGIAASRPNGTITKGEFVIAALGIGVVLLFVALVTNATSADDEHSEEIDPAEQALVQILD